MYNGLPCLPVKIKLIVVIYALGLAHEKFDA